MASDPEDFHLYGADPADVIAALNGVPPVIVRPPWQQNAACRGIGTGPFFRAPGGSLALAQSLCGRCRVTADCLGYALEHDLAGHWANTSERERRKLRRARRDEAA